MDIVKKQKEQPTLILWRNGIACARCSGVSLVVTFEQVEVKTLRSGWRLVGDRDGMRDALVARVGALVPDVSLTTLMEELADHA